MLKSEDNGDVAVLEKDRKNIQHLLKRFFATFGLPGMPQEHAKTYRNLEFFLRVRHDVYAMKIIPEQTLSIWAMHTVKEVKSVEVKDSAEPKQRNVNFGIISLHRDRF